MMLKRRRTLKFILVKFWTRFLILILLGLFFTYSFLYLEPGHGVKLSASSLYADLAVPTNLAVEQDDNNAILSWGDPIMPDKPNPENVTGYKISWGLAGSGAAPTIQLTSERMIQ